MPTMTFKRKKKWTKFERICGFRLEQYLLWCKNI